MSAPKRVLIVEDQEVFARSLRATVVERLRPDEVFMVDTVAGATRELARRPPDLVLLDLGLPDGPGVDVIEACRALRPPPKVIVLTIFDDDRHLFEALRRGVEGYVLKEESGEGLHRALSDILEGRPPLSADIARRVLLHVRTDEAEGTDPAVLTERERTILQMLAKGCTVAEAADHLGISAHTVQHHVKSLYRKLDVHSRAEMTRAAVDMGIV